MERRVWFELKGAGRSGGAPARAKSGVLTAAVEAAWEVLPTARAELSANWPPDEELEAALEGAGWDVRPPRRRTFLWIFAVESGSLQTSAVATDGATLRKLLAVVADADHPVPDLDVRLTADRAEGAELTITLADFETDLVAEGTGPESGPAVQAVIDVVERDARSFGLRAIRRT